MSTTKILHKFFREIILQKTIREGLLFALPFVITGSMALTILSVPIPDYQDYIKSAADGQIYYILNLLHTYTMSITPLILIFTMSISFGRAVCSTGKEILFYPIISFLSYLIFFKSGQSSFIQAFSTLQTFNVTLITITACLIFYFFSRWKYTDLKYYVRTYSYSFDIIYRMILPSVIVLLFFIGLQSMLTVNIIDLTKDFHLFLFSYLGNNFLGTALLLLLEHCYWFIGIHGFNMLAPILSYTLQDRMVENMQLVSLGLPPTQIYTKTFLDVFSTMGGCGSTFALVLAIFFFAKLPHTKRVAKLSFFPSMFNISEIIVIGLPILCNAAFFLPFVLIPIVNLGIASATVQLGLVPMTSQWVEWTIPPLLNGYLSTGSIAGVILQIFLLIIDALIYRPFIINYERTEEIKSKKIFKSLVKEVITYEKSRKSMALLNNSQFSDIIKLLSADLQQALQKKELQLFYQPQLNHDGTIYGGEALLRWHHPQFGYIYPPLIIFLAKENNLLDELGIYVIEQTCIDLALLTKKFEQPVKLSVNVAPPQLHHENFCQTIRELLAKHKLSKAALTFELTEQIALSSTQEIMERLASLREMGITLSMDDFGMGHSSVIYLQNSNFDIVKLDGNLTRKILTSQRSVDIITTITTLAKKFNFQVIAEYVESKEQRDKLAELGCHIYQGHLYSQAVPLEVFIRFLRDYAK